MLTTDLTETQPLERRADSVLQAEFLVEDSTGKYILVLESQTDVERDRLRRFALTRIDEETASSLSEFTEIGLGETPSAEIWKAMMATRTYPFVSQTRLQGREEGRAEGRAKGLAEGRVEGRAEGLAAAIFKVFDRRGIKVDDDSHQRIESCTDSDALEAWLDQSFIVVKASDLFA